jgi:hypothetical protein
MRQGLHKMALAYCHAYGLPRDHVPELMDALRHGRTHAQAHRVARRLLARQLGIPRGRLPATAGHSQAIGQYEAERTCREANHEPTVGFDLHSKRFAVENGVCPRCAEVGSFGETSGACRLCGWGYAY